MPARNLGTLAATLRRRLGFAAGGAQAGINDTHMKNLLYSAQVALYWDFDWPRWRTYIDTEVGMDEFLIDYPAELQPDRISKIYVQISDTWTKVTEGIEPELYTTQSNTSFPSRYERYEQIELWPISDQVYSLRIWGTKVLLPFTEDADLPSLDDETLFLYALATAKAHYRQPDATLIGNQWQKVAGNLKAKSWGKRSFGGGVGSVGPRRAEEEHYPWPKPQVEGR